MDCFVEGDYRDYENGVADVLRVMAGDGAWLERDVRLPGRRSGVPRQIDVLVRGTVFGLDDALRRVQEMERQTRRWRCRDLPVVS